MGLKETKINGIVLSRVVFGVESNMQIVDRGFCSFSNLLQRRLS